jgi:hypothetical protein
VVRELWKQGRRADKIILSLRISQFLILLTWLESAILSIQVSFPCLTVYFFFFLLCADYSELLGC